MQQAGDLPEITVPETGAVITAESLRSAGIRPGDRFAFARTTRGSRIALPATPASDGSALRAVVGVTARPARLGPEDDRAFLREMRSGGDER